MHERNQLILFGIQTLSKTPQCSTETTVTKGHTVATPHKRMHSTFLFHGVEVCQRFYFFLHGLSRKTYQTLSHHYQTSPVESRLFREHGNKGRLPNNTLSLLRKQEAQQFITNYTNKHTIPLPGCMPTVTDFTDQQLPSDTTKVKVYREYAAASDSPVSLTVFKELWPANIHVRKPQRDICTECQRNNRLIYKSVNLSDEMKTTKLERQQKSKASGVSFRM